MAIMPSQIRYYYSMGSSGASGAQGNPNASLGGTISSTLVSPNLNNVWNDVTRAEADQGYTEYRLLYVVNGHPTLTLTGAHVWVDSISTDPTILDVALDPAPIGSNSTRVLPGSTVAPQGVTFTQTAISEDTALLIGDIAPGQQKGIWERRIIPAGALNAIKIPSIRVVGDTVA